MNEIRLNELLSEMQRLTAAAGEGAASPELTAADRQQFADLLRASVDGVNEAQQTAEAMATAFERGDPQVGLPEVMIALQKASLSFQAMTEVRNQLVNAYQEIMNMPI